MELKQKRKRGLIDPTKKGSATKRYCTAVILLHSVDKFFKLTSEMLNEISSLLMPTKYESNTKTLLSSAQVTRTSKNCDFRMGDLIVAFSKVKPIKIKPHCLKMFKKNNPKLVCGYGR